MSDAGTAAAAVGTGTAAAAAAWHAGLDTETLGHVQGRGWDKLEPAAAAIEATKAHREAQKFIGRPTESLVVWPKDATDQDNWTKVYDKLGVPKEAKDYAFDDVKFADGTAPDAPFVDAIRTTALNAKLTPAQASAVAKDVVKLIEAGETTDSAEYTTKLEAEKEALKVDWGASNYTNNLLIAKNAAAKLGVDAEAVAALEKVVGYGKVMEMFRKMGKTMGEDNFVRSGAPGGNGGPMTKAEANTRLVDLRTDTEWLKRFNNGDATAKREFENLTAIAGS